MKLSENREAVKVSAISYVRGHLEGYADALVLTKAITRDTLVESLREDASMLAAVELVTPHQDRDFLLEKIQEHEITTNLKHVKLAHDRALYQAAKRVKGGQTELPARLLNAGKFLQEAKEADGSQGN